MKKALLIFLMLLLPWQAFAAMERNVAHFSGTGGVHGPAFVVKHMVEHAEQVLHHHDDDGDAAAGATHVDSSQKSVQHLADYDHAGSMHILLPTVSAPGLVAIARTPRTFWRDPFRTRSILPLLRPPQLPA